MKSWKKPTLEQIDRTIAMLLHPQQRIYFFNRLENPEWIEPLNKKGFFNHPPEVIEDTSQGTVSFPLWAESRYLARMAKEKPEEVLAIVKQIKSKNVRVYEDFIDAALQMPSQKAVQLAPKVITWIKESSYWTPLLPEKITNFILYLARDSHTKKALELAKALFDVMPDPRLNNRGNGHDSGYLPLLEPQIRFDKRHYQENLKKCVLALLQVSDKDKLDVLTMLLSFLSNAVLYSQNHEKSVQQQKKLLIWEDASGYWLDAIEDNYKYSSRNEIAQILVILVRATAEKILKDDKSKIRDIVSTIEDKHWRIFHRIALYLIRKFPEADESLLVEKLVDRERFTDTSFYEDYEYVYLLKDNFHRLSSEKQEEILNCIRNPEIDWDFLEDQEKKAEWVRRWQWKKLTIIKDSLSPYWQEFYQHLVGEFGSIEVSSLLPHSKIKTFFGSVSPKTDSELESMSIEELVNFLNTWEPSSTDMCEEPSRSWLGSTLTRIVEKNPERYTREAVYFQCLDTRYISNFLLGLCQAFDNQLKKQQEIKEFDWISVLSLCNWLAEQSEGLSESLTVYNQQDGNWLESYKRTLDLLEIGLNTDIVAIPFDLRDQIWNIFSLLTQHPDPTPEREMNYNNSNNYYSNLAINSIRGRAMHAVVRYALWIHRYFEEAPELLELLKHGFDKMPEVRQVLNDHLDLNIEQSLAIRSIYGQWFPWLALLDPLWAGQSVGKIFPQEDISRNLRHAAWESYINFSGGAYNNAFDLLYEEYCYAVEQINVGFVEPQNLTHTNEMLAQHLMTFYWRGKLTFDDPKRLLSRFFDLASDALRGCALEFVGRSLNLTKNEIESEVLSWLQLLWKKRLETACNSAEPSSYTNELAAFGWWFSSKKFDDYWAIEQIKQILQLTGKVNPDYSVLERLASLANTMVLDSIKCLELMIKSNQHGEWVTYSSHDETNTILCKAIQSNNEEAKKAAEEIIHSLGRRGNWQYRGLLPRANASKV